MKEFRPCGDCSACCDGHYSGNAYGNYFGKRKPCIFLQNSLCNIYDTRPGFCRNFQCAWSQFLLDEDMRPDQCGLLVSVEKNKETGNQFLKAVEIWKDVPYETYQKIDRAARHLNTEWILIKYDNDSTR